MSDGSFPCLVVSRDSWMDGGLLVVRNRICSWVPWMIVSVGKEMTYN